MGLRQCRRLTVVPSFVRKLWVGLVWLALHSRTTSSARSSAGFGAGNGRQSCSPRRSSPRRNERAMSAPVGPQDSRLGGFARAGDGAEAPRYAPHKDGYTVVMRAG